MTDTRKILEEAEFELLQANSADRAQAYALIAIATELRNIRLALAPPISSRVAE